MPWRVPDDPERTYAAQAVLTGPDLEALVAGIAGDGVVTGCEVAAQSTPNTTVAVAVGAIRGAGAQVNVSAGNVTPAAANGSLDRIDLIQANTSTGAKSAKSGTAAASPRPPDPDAGNVLLALVYRPAGISTITNAEILSRVVLVARHGVRANGGTTYARRRTNYVPGANVTISVADDAANEETVVTIASTAAGGGLGVNVQDEGTPLPTVADTLNFTGTGVTVTGAGNAKAITIPGASFPFVTKTANATILVTERRVLANPASAPITLTLPSAATAGNGWDVFVKNASVYAIVVVGAIDGQPSYTLGSQWTGVTLCCDGSAYYVVGEVA